jgi:hypothetical protein
MELVGPSARLARLSSARCLMAKRPRSSFDEVIAALDPAERTRIDRIETFFDPSADKDDAEVSVGEDPQPGEWRVEYFQKADGYVTIFAGPMAEQRARAYFDALKSGALKVMREDGRSGSS